MRSRLVAFLFLLLVLGAGYVYWATRNLPSISKVLKDGVSTSHLTQVYAADGTVILSYGKFHQKNAKLSEVSSHFVDALLATEDRRFYQHKGVDPIAVGRAIIRDITQKRLLEGGSTLTQQLARNIFLSNERSLKRKVREAALAIRLEQELTKDQILELYINNIYFGEGAYGIQAASEIYFDKQPSQLTWDEAALLAGLPQAPSIYTPFHNPEEARKRRNEVLDNLVETGKLSAEEAGKYQGRGFHLNTSGAELASGDRAPFFNRYVLNQIREQFDLDEQTFWQSGLKVYTTLDPYAQGLAARAVRNQSVAYGRKDKNQQAALLSLDPRTGAILAYVGGKNYSVSQFDRVSQALRSPGSLFKVFTYTTAIDRGFEPSRVYLDAPIQFGNWRPMNYDKRYHGYMTLARALTQSNNVIAVKVLQEIGPPAVIDMAHRMGIRAALEDNLSLTLGSSGVTLMDMTSAFGVLANQGVRAESYAIARIVDASGRTLYEHQPAKSDVLSRPTVDTMVSMMMGVVRHGTGRLADIGRPVAAKTGTSDDHRDAWFIGFTPDTVTGVWVGNDDNTSMKGITGGALPAAIWKAFMRPYLAGKTPTAFDLAYSKPLAEADFITYDLKNLSENESATAEVVDGEGGLEGEETIPLRPAQDPLMEDPTQPPVGTPNPLGEPGAQPVEPSSPVTPPEPVGVPLPAPQPSPRSPRPELIPIPPARNP